MTEAKYTKVQLDANDIKELIAEKYELDPDDVNIEIVGPDYRYGNMCMYVWFDKIAK